jgi:muconolactone delta-isomerase
VIEIGKWDHLEGSIGKRGTGKSTHQCVRAMELCIDAGGAIVIGHSIGGRLPTRLPEEYGGHVLPIQYHESINSIRNGVRRHPGRWHILAPPITADVNAVRETADDLIKFSIELSRAMRKKAWERTHPFGVPGARFGWRDNVNHEGVQATPIILIIDEGIAIEAAGPTRKDANRWFLEFLYSLRHMHIALLYAIQDASARSWRILEQATTLYVFRVSHEWALQSIAAAGASDEQLDEVANLPRFRFVELDLRAPMEADSAVDKPALQAIEAKTPDGTPA